MAENDSKNKLQLFIEYKHFIFNIKMIYICNLMKTMYEKYINSNIGTCMIAYLLSDII